MNRKGLFTAGVALLTGCGWFESPHQCSDGELSCDGPRIRVCAQQPSRNSETGYAYRWKVLQVCDATSPLGPLTCSMESGSPACVLAPDGGVDGAVEAADGAAPGGGTTAPREYWRVDVERAGDGTWGIVGTTRQELAEMPTSAAAGEVSVVAVGAGDEVVDAVLVPVGADATSVWVGAEGAVSINVVDPNGTLQSSRPLTGQIQAPDGGLEDGDGGLEDADVSDADVFLGGLPDMPAWPVTLRIARPLVDKVKVPKSMKAGNVGVVSPTDEHLALVAEAFEGVPLQAVSAITTLAFVSDDWVPFLEGAPDAATSFTGSLGDAGVAGAPEYGPGIGEDMWVTYQGAPPASPIDPVFNRARSDISGTTLVVDVSPRFMEIYASRPEQREAFKLELVRRVGESYYRIGAGATNDATKAAVNFSGAKLPWDFPPSIASALRKHISPMLGPLESFDVAWEALHGVAAGADLAEAYLPVTWGEVDDATAVKGGFASSLGAQMPMEDFAEYLAYATHLEAWGFGPCNAIRAKPVDKLDPRLLVAVTKLHVLWGLGLLTSSRLEQCIGKLPVADQTPGFAVHRADGLRMKLGEDVGGAVSTFLYGETHVSGFGAAADVHVAFDEMYRFEAPAIVRLNPVQNVRVQDFGATFALTDDKDSITSPSNGGLMVLTEVSETRIAGRVLMLAVGKKIPSFGNRTVFPLVTFHVPAPTYAMGGVEGLDGGVEE